MDSEGELSSVLSATRDPLVEEAFRREEEQMDMENLSVGVTHGLERTYFVASSSVQAVFGIED